MEADSEERSEFRNCGTAYNVAVWYIELTWNLKLTETF
jgi:hypothetical protein